MCPDRKCGVSQGRAGTVSVSATNRVPASELLVFAGKISFLGFAKGKHNEFEKAGERALASVETHGEERA